MRHRKSVTRNGDLRDRRASLHHQLLHHHLLLEYHQRRAPRRHAPLHVGEPAVRAMQLRHALGEVGGGQHEVLHGDLFVRVALPLQDPDPEGAHALRRRRHVLQGGVLHLEYVVIATVKATITITVS